MPEYKTCPCHYSFWPIRFRSKFLAPFLRELPVQIVVIVSFYIGVQLWLATQSLCLAISSIFRTQLGLLLFFPEFHRDDDSCNEGHQEDAPRPHTSAAAPDRAAEMPSHEFRLSPCFPNGYLLRFWNRSRRFFCTFTGTTSNVHR